jgi:hypothetical protein
MDLPKANYNSDKQILEAIRKKIINNTNGVESSDSYLIVKKESSMEISIVHAHDDIRGEYKITVGKKDFILYLKQEEFN